MGVFTTACAGALGSATAQPQRTAGPSACDSTLELCLLDPPPWISPQRIQYRGPAGARALEVRLLQGAERTPVDSVEIISRDETTKTWQAILPPDLQDGQLEIRATTEGVELSNVSEGPVEPVVGETELKVSGRGDRREAVLTFVARGPVQASLELKLKGKYPAEKSYETAKTWNEAKDVDETGPAKLQIAADDLKKRCKHYAKCRLSARAEVTSLSYTVAKESAEEKVPTSPERFEGSLGFVPGNAFSGGGGRRYDYAVYVEDGIKIDRKGFAMDIAATLGDKRSWKQTGEVSFKQVKSKSQADTKVILASPKLVDRLCAPLDTDGYVSCTQGSSVILNLDRWRKAVPHFDSLLKYRRMLTNHEIGHRIGQGHRECPGSGKKAPVMQQQTYGLQGCRANPWPLDSEARSVRASGRHRASGAGPRRAWLD